MRILIVFLGAVLATVSAIDVFHIEGADGRYTILSRDDAKTLCKAYNGRLASIDELEAAQKAGLDKCNCGWLDGNSAALPLQAPRPGCGSSPGVHYCPKHPSSWGGKGWDAYCVREQTVDCANEYAFGIGPHDYPVQSSDWAQIFEDIKFPASGKVAGWTYYSLRPDVQAYAAVWRKVAEDPSPKFQFVGRNRLPLGRVGRVNWVVDENYQIEVQGGDVIGLHYDSIIDFKGKAQAVIPMAQSPDHLCSSGGDGNCLTKDQVSRTYAIHRHEQQLTYKRDLVIDLANIKEKFLMHRAPALRPVMCANNAGDLPTAATTTTTEEPTTVTEQATTPAETVEPETPSPPIEVTTTTAAPEPETTTTEEVTKEPTKSTTLKPPPETTTPHTTTTQATTTTEEITTTLPPAPVVTEIVGPVFTEAGEGVAEAESKETPCHFPFMYRKQLVPACTMAASETLWCSTEATYDGSHWRNCHDGDLTVDQMPCHFPFNYKNESYSSCITAFDNKPWCSVSEDYNPHSWKYCTDEDQSVEALDCHLPFEYQGKQHNMCIKAGSANYWCATAPKYGTYAWRNCHDGDPIPESMPCHYPFVFDGKEQTSCIQKGSSKEWCSVEAEYNGENWRNCREGDTFAKEEPCHFPFKYHDRDVNKCISENSNNPWCSVVPVYDYTKNWRYCRNVELIAVHGAKVKSSADAAAKCKEQGMVLAMERDATAAYELGNESCDCGWTSAGYAVKYIQDPRENCGAEEGRGVHKCGDSEDGYAAVCVVA